MVINIFRQLILGKETFLQVSADSNSFKMLYWLAPGGGVPVHIHEDMDELFVILEGNVTFIVESKKISKTPGESLTVKKMVPHGIKNLSNTTIKMEVVFTPSSDTVSMFNILFFLNDKYPGKASNMMKYFYMYPRLGLKPFSAVPSKLIMSAVHFIITVIGGMAGWQKLVKEYAALK